MGKTPKYPQYNTEKMGRLDKVFVFCALIVVMTLVVSFLLYRAERVGRPFFEDVLNSLKLIWCLFILSEITKNAQRVSASRRKR
jgi:hypothetical protein